MKNTGLKIENSKIYYLKFLIIGILILSSCQQRTNLIDVDNSQILSKAEQLPHEGVLKVVPSSDRYDAEARFIYLEVDDRYISELYPLLKERDFLSDKNQNGAHITVFLNKESERLPETIPEIGQVFHFTIDKLKIATVTKFDPKTEKHFKKEYIILEVKSPELETLRNKYEFPALPYGTQQLHITIAEKIDH